jgi:hypothetical protein
MPFHILKLTGLNGSNPLAFLAALGVFRTAQRVAEYEVRLGWTPFKNSWYPFFQGNDDFLSKPDELIRKIYPILIRGNRAFGMAKNANNIKMPAKTFRLITEEALEKWFEASSSEFLDFIIAFGNDSMIDKNGDIEDTFFRTMQGAGHQHFLKFMRELTANTTKRQLHEAMFETWKYCDTGFSLRWDPEDDRRYALRWDNPSGDPARNVRGANRLAIEGIPMYPTIPTTNSLKTTGFEGNNASNTFWIWPVWKYPISIDVCRSLLAHAELQKNHPSIELFQSIGVSAIFKSQRITQGKFRNFTPSVVIGM